MGRHLALYRTEELDLFLELQLLPAAKSMITNRLMVNQCEGDGACPLGVSVLALGRFYSFERNLAEAEETFKSFVPFISWMKDIWSKIDNVNQISGLMPFVVILGLALKLLVHMLCHQICRWWMYQ